MKHTFKPNKHEPGSSTNETRAANAECALLEWVNCTHTSEDESNIRDLIGDLGHLCDRDGLDFEAFVNSALMNWRAER